MKKYLERDFEKLKYQDQLTYKFNVVDKLYKTINFNDVSNIISNPIPKNYRHKVIASATTINNKLRLGLYEQGSKKIKPGVDHIVHDLDITNLLNEIEIILNKYKISAYNIDKEIGILKHVLVKKSHSNQKMIVTFVTNGHVFPNNKNIIKDILLKFENVISITQNIQNKKSKYVILENNKILYGPGYIIDKVGRYHFKIRPNTFFQVNPVQMINLYNKALSLLDFKKEDIVIDAYAGIGTISSIFHGKVKQVYSVENNKTSSYEALQVVKDENIKNIQVVNQDVLDFINNFNNQADLLIMDPPREGSNVNFLTAVKKLKPRNILYISCNPITQVRDIKSLLDIYEIIKVIPVDMFSYTTSIEVITLLKIKGGIENESSKNVRKIRRANR